MPVGYLISVALVAWSTVFALAPLRRTPRLARLSWRSAFVVSELPFLGLLWLFAATALAAGEGDIDTLGGQIVFGLAILTAVGLLVVVSRAVGTSAAVERALRDGLGADWRNALDPAIVARVSRRPAWARILFLPWPVRPREVQRIRDIRYGAAGERNLLDVYRHRRRPSRGPVLVYFHGGGFFSGRKNREARPLLHRLASQGWVCISANYRLGPAATFADRMIDAKRALAWARAHANDHGADPDLLFVSGSSAGGHLAAIAALTPNEPAFQPGFEHADTTVAAAVTLYGYLGPCCGQGGESSPESYVRVDAPPFFVAQGDHDSYSPRFAEIAWRFAERLRACSAHPVVYAELPGGQHSFDLFHSIRFDAVIAAIEAFAAWVRSTRAGQREPAHLDAGANPQAEMAPRADCAAVSHAYTPRGHVSL
jgi:acetyl esterase/lipase